MQEFLDRIEEPNIHLYCHALTPVLLGAFEKYFSGRSNLHDLIQRRRIRPLNVNQPYTIEAPRIFHPNQLFAFKVTLLPAGHCPGSVM